MRLHEVLDKPPGQPHDVWGVWRASKEDVEWRITLHSGVIDVAVRCYGSKHPGTWSNWYKLTGFSAEEVLATDWGWA